MQLKPGQRVVSVVPETSNRWFASRIEEENDAWVERVTLVILIEEPAHRASLLPEDTRILQAHFAYTAEDGSVMLGEQHEGFYAIVEGLTEADALKNAQREWDLMHK